jgi:peptide/nickel transport system permease protein
MESAVIRETPRETGIAPKSRGLLAGALLQLVQNPVGIVGLLLVLVFIFVAIAAPILASFDPVEQPAKRLQPPSREYLFGTDEFGRDIFSRIVYGARVSLQVGIISVSIAVATGATLGIISGYYVGLFDSLMMRLVDIMFAFPTVIFVVALAAVMGPSTTSAMIAIGIVSSPAFVRIARGPTLSVAQKEYVEGARAIGAGEWRIMFHYVLPNIAAPLIVQTTLSFSTAILVEAALSFLGLGTQPPNPSWGTMLGEGRRYMELAPWVAIYPGLAIALTVLGLNLLGDALRDALDPRLRSS